MTNFKTLSIFLMVFALFGLNSCDNDDDANPNGIVPQPDTVDDVINVNSSLSLLEIALNKASGSIPETLKGEGPFTVFAPDNGAFDKLATETGFEDGADLVAKIDADLLATILTNHVVAGNNSASALTEGTKFTTLANGELTVTISVQEVEDGDDVSVVQLLDARKVPQTKPVSNVTQTDRNSGNGVVHIVDTILLPQEAIDALNIDTRPTLLDYATSSEDLSTLVAALTKAGLVETVTELDAATILAPTNQAFANLLEVFGDDYNSLDDFDNEAEIALLGNILKYHVLTTDALMAGDAETAFVDNTVEVIAANGGFAFGDRTNTDAGAVDTALEAKNGFVQVIDKVLLPQAVSDFDLLLKTPDLAKIVVDAPQLGILEEALVATKLVETFTDATNAALNTTATNFTYFRPATVFAPTDDAFTALFAELGDDYTSIASFDTEDEIALLTQILLYHVVPGKITGNDLIATDLTTAAESDIQIIKVVGGNGFVIGDATNDVNANIVAEVAARNGVAHVIDKVLLSQGAVNFITSLNEKEGEN